MEFSEQTDQTCAIGFDSVIASVLSGKFVSLIRDGFSSSVRRATQQCQEYFEVAQQSCRRKDAEVAT